MVYKIFAAFSKFVFPLSINIFLVIGQRKATISRTGLYSSEAQP